MANDFQFTEQEYSSSLFAKLNEWTQSVRNDKQANITGCNRKSEFVKNLGKDLKGSKDQVKNGSEFKYWMQRQWEYTFAASDGKMKERVPTLPSWMQPEWARDRSQKWMEKFDSKLEYRVNMYNKWLADPEDSFASTYCAERPLSVPTFAFPVCPICRHIVGDLADKTIKVDLASILSSAEQCRVCSLLVRSFLDDVDENGKVTLFRNIAALRIGYRGRRAVRFSTPLVYTGQLKNQIPTGRPMMPIPDRAERFHLLGAWVRWCNANHDCNKTRNRGEPRGFPTRVLDVGGLQDMGSPPGWIRLLNAEERRSDQYIALSHCWGNLSESQKRTYCTSQGNLARRQHAFHISELPKTFQDAIKVANSLEIPYLWIDSLCIVQFDDDGADFERESVRMYNVYSQAYCTIAATAANDSYHSFLDRYRESENIFVQDDQGKRFFVSTDIDDYDGDVSNSTLNSRAWVMQETVLARRTVHFSTNQMYWTCGQGLYCENLVKFNSPLDNTYFALDPAFPMRLMQARAGYHFARVESCVSYFIQDFARRGLTNQCDKKVAIQGLEETLTAALCCETRFGIFQMFLNRNLSWKTVKSDAQIIKHNGYIPSWSWMACTGGAEFPMDPYGSLSLNKNISFHHQRKEALLSDLGIVTNCTLHSHGGDYTLFDAAGKKVGWISLDIKSWTRLQTVYCVVVSRYRAYVEFQSYHVKRYRILAVTSTGRINEYRRIGFGTADVGHVTKVQDIVQII